MAIFGLIHLSDTHYHCNRLRYPDACSGAFIDPLKQIVFRLLTKGEVTDNYRMHFSAIVATGDLAHTGQLRDLEAARDIFKEFRATSEAAASERKSNKKKFGFLPESSQNAELVTLPGNYDRYAIAQHKPKSAPSDSFFTVFDKWNINQGSEVRINKFTLKPSQHDFSERKDAESLCVLCADFSHVAGDSPAKGIVEPQVLNDLIERTKKERESAAVIWACHFAPQHEGKSVRPDLQLEKDTTLVRKARSLGVKLILCGHTHEHDIYPEANSTPRIVCAGSACCAPSPSFFTLRIRVEGKLIVAIDCARYGIPELDDRNMPNRTKAFHLLEEKTLLKKKAL